MRWRLGLVAVRLGPGLGQGAARVGAGLGAELPRGLAKEPLGRAGRGAAGASAWTWCDWGWRGAARALDNEPPGLGTQEPARGCAAGLLPELVPGAGVSAARRGCLKAGVRPATVAW